METVDELPAALRGGLSKTERLLVAFSGGVDSALVAAVAADVLGDCALAVTAVSPSLPEAERAAARAFARDRGIAVRAAGFDFCALDLQGFRSGRMNVLLTDAG